uniref:TIR domain containing adaptor molecule 1 n=1 Tax=Tetraodon nigroviridis TaxID=99883 RepID=H3C6H1_TETNG
MSHGGHNNQGTGPGDILDILVKTPLERLLSLTLQPSESPEGNVVHVLCLIVLQREKQALGKLHTLGNSLLSKHLSETWLMSRGKLEDFALSFRNFQNLTSESVVLLARVFKVLSEQRLCDPHLRDVAYRRALSTVGHTSEPLGYEQLKEEAVAVCGPQVAEWMCSYVSGLGSLSVLDSNRLPSPLDANPSTLSYPTHLEISTSSTAFVKEDRTPETPQTPQANPSVLLRTNEVGTKDASEPCPVSEEPQLKSSEFAGDSLVLSSLPASTFATGPSFAAPSTYVPAETRAACDLEESGSTGEEEATFYGFVIMHAPEDADAADDVREKMEKIIDCKGATFSDDFHVPGKSTLGCVEDAINNTAFTILLLTQNFTTRMVELQTSSALINSLNRKHKWNTVIPLLPLHNCMPKQDIPLILQTIVPLQENKNFERKILKSISLQKIKRQEKIWMEEQRMKLLKARQQQLKHQKQLMKESEKAQWQEKERLRLQLGQPLLNPNVLGEDDEDGRAWWQHSNIHIESANYIIIGNDSQM